jgi:dTDP-glucose 4,6-dehydratase
MDDVSDATYRAAIQGIPGETYHISTREIVSIRDLVQKICALTGVAFEDLAQVAEERLGKDQAYLLDSSKIRSTLGWQDRIGLDQGLQETLGWIDSNLDTLKTLPQDYIHKP